MTRTVRSTLLLALLTAACGTEDESAISDRSSLLSQQDGVDPSIALRSVFNTNNIVAGGDRESEPTQRHFDETFRRLRAEEIRDFQGAATGVFERLSRPAQAATDTALASVLMGSGLSAEILDASAIAIRQASKRARCVLLADPQEERRLSPQRQSGRVRVIFTGCPLGMRQEVSIAGLAVVEWAPGWSQARFDQAALVVPGSILPIEMTLFRRDGYERPETRVRVERLDQNRNDEISDAWSVVFDDLTVDRVRGRVAVEASQAHLRWAYEPETAFDFGARIEFDDGGQRDFVRFDIGGSYRDVRSDGSRIEVARIDLTFDPSGRFRGNAFFEATRDSDALLSDSSDPEGVRIEGTREDMVVDGPMLVEINRESAPVRGRAIAHSVHIDAANVDLPPQGAFEMLWGSGANDTEMMIYFQDNSPATRWVKVYHREKITTTSRISGRSELSVQESWYCVRMSFVPLPFEIDSEHPTSHYCE